jgi:Phosphotransferase enzyme family
MAERIAHGKEAGRQWPSGAESPSLPLLRRLDGRFLLPPPAGGAFEHLVILGGPPGIAEAAAAAGIARRVSTSPPPEGSADALFLLRGADVVPEEAARCLAPGGCAYLEGVSPRRLRKGRLRMTGAYAVHPDFERQEAYVPLDPLGARRWFAENRLPAWTLRKALRRALRDLLPHRSVALTAVAGAAEGGSESILDHPALPTPLRGQHPLLLSHGPERVVVLAFPPGGALPSAVLKVPRVPTFNGRTEEEQSLIVHLRGRLGRTERNALPQPRGLYRGDGLIFALEGYVEGRPLAQRIGSWGAARRGQVRDLWDAADWLAGFHQRTEVRRIEWDDRATAEWIGGPLVDLRAMSPASVSGDVPKLLATAHRRAGELAGAELPIVCQHRDFTTRNLLRGEMRGDNGLRVIDWKEARFGPALCDLLHFATHWSELALRAFDDWTRLHVFQEVWIARRGGEPGEAVRRAVAGYCDALRIDRRFVPLLLVATWAELALRRGPGSREAAYLDVLARGAEELFAGGR